MALVNIQNNQIKDGKLPAKLAEEIPWNKLYVDIILTYIKQRKGKKENLHLKAVTMIDRVTRCFEVVQYYYKRAITIVNLVETI